MNAKKEKRIGAIFPDEGAFAYELLDIGFVEKWLADHGYPNVGYLCERTPGGKAATFEACDELANYDYLLPAARELADQGADVIFWACVSGSFHRGLDFAHQQAKAMADAAGCPATSGALAMLTGCKSLGAKKADVMMAYMPDVAQRFVNFLQEGGLDITEVRHMVCAPKQRSFDLDYHAELSKFAKQFGPRDYPLLIPSTSVNSLTIMQDFERLAGRPVITANQSCLWHSLRLLGIDKPAQGAGQLFLK